MSALPSLGRIVLVRSPKFLVEFPAIVVRVYSGVSEEHCDVQVFTDEDCGTVFLSAIGPQSESAKQYGWRWPPRVSEQPSNVAETLADLTRGEPVPTLSSQEPLTRV